MRFPRLRWPNPMAPWVWSDVDDVPPADPPPADEGVATVPLPLLRGVRDVINDDYPMLAGLLDQYIMDAELGMPTP